MDTFVLIMNSTEQSSLKGISPMYSTNHTITQQQQQQQQCAIAMHKERGGLAAKHILLVTAVL